jgi:hypothetical protein
MIVVCCFFYFALASRLRHDFYYAKLRLMPGHLSHAGRWLK